MTEDLMTIVLDRANEDDELPEEAKLLVLAAMEGDADLAQALDANAPTPSSRCVDVRSDERAATSPARAYLSAISVEGFRGVGPAATLRLRPGPGLVVIAGRNGCGKSSFAEAVEVAFTRGSYRWRHRPQYWHESWRNLDQKTTASIVVELIEEGHGATKVGASWAPDAGLDDATSWVQRPGGRREPGLDSLGWSAALDVYRPFLSYDELSAVFAERSKMYSALAPILGLERLEDAQQRLRTVEKSLSIPKDAAAAIVRDLRPDVEALDDPRARAVYAQIRRRRPDLEALRALVTTGTSPADGGLDRLRTLAASSAPDPALFDQARDRFLQARNALEGLERSAQVADIRRRDLLAAALAVQRADGEGPCPVCGVGVLDHDWARRTETELLRQRELAASRVDAHQELDAAVRALTAVTGPPPTALAALMRDPIPDLPDGLTEQCANLLSAWQAWHALAEAPDRLARDGRVALDELHSVADVVSQAARDELARREDQWQPLALRVAEWLGHAERAATVQDRLATVKTASAWFKRNTHELRNDRIRPLTERARHVWSLLRQGSSVELGEITLAGSNNSRRVELLAAVGESQAEALGVMSQGELHALALALFLPKATAPDSPFGFVVIDDPVQAMDPAKVDGLARALEEAATDRQVVVLTHDDRLPEAVRRLGIEARILEVVRDHGSRITVTNAVDPAFRYLDDARAVARDEKLPDPVRRKVVAALCRMAAEAGSRDVFFARRLSTGAGRADVERVWSEARRTRQKVALAVKDDAGADLGSWSSSRSHGPALTVCSSRSHDGVTGDVCGAVEAVAHLVRDLGDHHGR